MRILTLGALAALAVLMAASGVRAQRVTPGTGAAPPLPRPPAATVTAPSLGSPSPTVKVAPSPALPKASPALPAAPTAVQIVPPCRKPGDCPDPRQSDANERARRKFAQCQSEAKGNQAAMDKCLFGVFSPSQLAALKRCLGRANVAGAPPPAHATLARCIKDVYAAR